jgi:hypothetical protein
VISIYEIYCSSVRREEKNNRFAKKFFDVLLADIEHLFPQKCETNTRSYGIYFLRSSSTYFEPTFNIPAKERKQRACSSQYQR